MMVVYILSFVVVSCNEPDGFPCPLHDNADGFTPDSDQACSIPRGAWSVQ